MRGPRTTRRRFLLGALATGVTTAIPLDVLLGAARAAAASGTHFLTDPVRFATCDALCSRIVPSQGGPGAAEAGAVYFIDFFLAAFELPTTVADNPAIHLRGRFSGRNPYPDPSTGGASSTYPASDFVGPGGVRHFSPLSPMQRLSWMAQLYGPKVIVDDASLPAAYRRNVADGLIPLPPPLRTTYAEGLDAYDTWSQQLFGVHFADATPAQQDLMVEASGDPAEALLSRLPLPGPVPPPPAAVALFPVIVVHTFQGCYGLPEYGGNGGVRGGGARSGLMWRSIVWDGDTEPLGNSVYDPLLTDAELVGAQGHNAGFGDPAVYTPRGGYREYRPVSTPGPGTGALTAGDLAGLVDDLRRLGIVVPEGGTR